MKKIISIFGVLAIIFIFAGCGNAAANNGNTLSEAPEVSGNNSAEEQYKNDTDRRKEAITVGKNIIMNITAGDMTFTANLEDNDTVKELVKKLPLTLDMSELNGNEKYYYLSGNLSADKSSCPGTIQEGDLMLYGNNCIVLFYRTFNTSYSYIKLGHLNNTGGLAEALGSGNVKVTFSIAE